MGFERKRIDWKKLEMRTRILLTNGARGRDETLLLGNNFNILSELRREMQIYHNSSAMSECGNVLLTVYLR